MNLAGHYFFKVGWSRSFTVTILFENLGAIFHDENSSWYFTTNRAIWPLTSLFTKIVLITDSGH